MSINGYNSHGNSYPHTTTRRVIYRQTTVYNGGNPFGMQTMPGMMPNSSIFGMPPASGMASIGNPFASGINSPYNGFDSFQSRGYNNNFNNRFYPTAKQINPWTYGMNHGFNSTRMNYMGNRMGLGSSYMSPMAYSHLNNYYSNWDNNNYDYNRYNDNYNDRYDDRYDDKYDSPFNRNNNYRDNTPIKSFDTYKNNVKKSRTTRFAENTLNTISALPAIALGAAETYVAFKQLGQLMGFNK